MRREERGEDRCGVVGVGGEGRVECMRMEREVGGGRYGRGVAVGGMGGCGRVGGGYNLHDTAGVVSVLCSALSFSFPLVWSRHFTSPRLSSLLLPSFFLHPSLLPPFCFDLSVSLGFFRKHNA